MPQDTIEERVAYLEGKVDEQSRGYGELRDAIQHVGGQIVALDQKVERFRDQLSGRIDGLGTRVDHLDQKVDRFREELSGRIDALGQKVSRQFVWIVGIQITILVTVVSVLAAALFRG
jgi:tetrahydromethanopterin S-methyltransferase subunit G